MIKYLNKIAIVLTVLLGAGLSNCYATVVYDTNGDYLTDSSNHPVSDSNGPPLAAPAITSQPVNVTINALTATTFSVVATGNPTPSFQWYQENPGATSFTAIPGATNSSYTTTTVTMANSSTQYECVVSTVLGTVTSNEATLFVSGFPSIITQPVSVSVAQPLAAAFNVVATGYPTPTYQWQQEAVGASTFTPISGATSASYTTPATAIANSGTKYNCVISNSSGSVTSNEVTLTIYAAPSITTQPTNAKVIAPATATFSVVATGSPTPSYQWMQETPGSTSYIPISGATSASYTTPALYTSNSGTSYECLITNAGGSITTNTVLLTVNSPPPSAPQLETATVAGDGQVKLTWGAVSGATSYSIAYTTSGSGYGTPIVAGNVTSYTMGNLTDGRMYTFVATATNANGTSINSNPVSATPEPMITASAATGGTISPSGSISVKYGAPETFIITPNAGYNINQVTDNGKPVMLSNKSYSINNVLGPHTIAASFTLTTPSNLAITSLTLPSSPIAGQKIPLIVNYINHATTIAGAFSVSVSVDSTAKGSCNVTSLAASATGTCLVQWTATSGNHAIVATLIPNGQSVPSNNDVAGGVLTVQADTTPPTAPSNLTAQSITTMPAVLLQWGASSDNVSVAGYDVYRDGTMVLPGTTTTSWYDTSAAPGTTHNYYVVAFDPSGNISSASSTVSGSMPMTELVINKSSSSEGTVTGSGYASFSCGTTCTGLTENVLGAETLTATPAPGFVFSGWSGACSGTGSCLVNLTNANQTVTAAFQAAPSTEIITNNTTSKVTITGAWGASTTVPGYYGTNYLEDGDVLQGTKSVLYTPSLAGGAGSYQVFLWYTSYYNRASNVHVDIIHSGITSTVIVNQQINGGQWVSLGTYNFLANGSGEGVKIRNTAANGYVIANAVEFSQLTAAPVITTQPVNATVTASNIANFNVVATGNPTPTYQWSQAPVGSTNFMPIPGATNATYTTPNTIMANSGMQFECVVSNSAGSVVSNIATLTVNPMPIAPTITTQPSNASVAQPATATFSVVAGGTPAPSYQWFQEASGASSFTPINGATSASYTTPATNQGNSQTQFYCVVTNSAGSVTSNVATLTVNPVTSYIQNINYNANGQITQVQYGNGTTTAYTYNPLNFRLMRIFTSNAQAQVIQDLNYTYDSIGQVLTIVDNVNTGSASMSQSFAYDALNRLISATGSYGTKSYSYDSIGNIKEKDGLTYNYGEANSRTNGTAAGPHAVTSLSDGSTFKYDLNGNMVTLQKGSNTTQYVYDSQNRLQSVSVGAQTIASYTYDGDGGRTQKTVYRRDMALYNNNTNPLLFGSTSNTLPATAQNPTVNTTIDVGNLYETESGTSRNTDFIFLGDTKIASIDSSGNTFYYHADHLGGTNVLTDATGAVRELTEYDPFGLVTVHEKFGSDFATAWYYFTGKPLDDETGLIFLGARYYNPVLGRFITPDTVVQAPSNPQTLNRYTYCNNNPVNLVDPSGHSWFSKLFKTIGDFISPLIRAIVTGQWGHFFQQVLNTAEIVIGAATGNPFLIASGALSYFNTATSSFQGGDWSAFHQIAGYVSLGLAVAGSALQIYNSFTSVTNATASAASTTNSASTAGVTGNAVAQNAPYYQTGDLVRAFNSVNATVMEQVNIGQTIVNTANHAGTASFFLQNLAEGFAKLSTAGAGVASAGLGSVALGAGIVFFAPEEATLGTLYIGGELITNGALVADIGGAANAFGGIFANILNGTYIAAGQGAVSAFISDAAGRVAGIYGVVAKTAIGTLSGDAVDSISKWYGQVKNIGQLANI